MREAGAHAARRAAKKGHRASLFREQSLSGATDGLAVVDDQNLEAFELRIAGHDETTLPEPDGKRTRVLTYRYNSGYATLVTFS